MNNILIINGPNLNLLGIREEEVYGHTSFEEYYAQLEKFAGENDIELDYFQSNNEGLIIDYIHKSIGIMDYIIINPGALSHYSYSIHDAIISSKIPTIEVHISNIYSREQFRRHSVVSPAVVGVISGLGLDGYRLALEYFNKSPFLDKKK
jgi:3-dehydroquinate dehydratase II